MKIRGAPIAAALAALLVAAPVAAAHVTLNPREWEAGGFAKFDMRVPNENESGDTTKSRHEVPGGGDLGQLPAGRGLAADGEDGPARRADRRRGRADHRADRHRDVVRRRASVPASSRSSGCRSRSPRTRAGDRAGVPGRADLLEPRRSPALDRSGGRRLAGTDGHGARGAARGGAAEEATPRARAGADAAGGEQDEESDTLSIVALVVGHRGAPRGARGAVPGRSASRRPPSGERRPRRRMSSG